MKITDKLTKEEGEYKSYLPKSTLYITMSFGILFIIIPFVPYFVQNFSLGVRMFILVLGVFGLLYGFQARKPIATFNVANKILKVRKSEFSSTQNFQFNKIHHLEINRVNNHSMLRVAIRDGLKEYLFNVVHLGVAKDEEIWEFIDELYELMEIPHPKETV